MKTIIITFFLMISFADQPRKVLLFYSENGKAQWKNQLEAFEAAQKGIRERDVEVSSIPFTTQNAELWKKWKVDSSQAFTFILIGRDGGEKLRSKEMVKTEKLFGTIDAMPMRRSEVNNKK